MDDRYGRRVWLWLVPIIALPVTAAMVAGGVFAGYRLLRPDTATSLPDMCAIYDSGDGRRVLAGMGAASGKRIPKGAADRYGQWKLCAFGTPRFPPMSTFQIQLDLYAPGKPETGVEWARHALHGGTDFGCSGPPTDIGAGEEGCEGLTRTSWVQVVAREGNVIAMASCSAAHVSDADRRTLRHAADLALDAAL